MKILSKGSEGNPGDVTPITVGPGNALPLLGVSWRWLRDHAGELGLQFVSVGGKRLLLASDVRAVLEARARASQPESGPELAADELAAMRRKIARAG